MNDPAASVVATDSETASELTPVAAESSTDSVESAVPHAAKVKADIPAKIHLFHFIEKFLLEIGYIFFEHFPFQTEVHPFDDDRQSACQDVWRELAKIERTFT